MPFLLIVFPVFNPIAISIGPIAIRWYALAYIGGIVLGWIYARALIKNERLWGGPAPITLLQTRRFHSLGHRRHHPRRPHRLCAVLQSAVLHPASRRDFRIVEGRHVVPRRLPRLRRRGDVFCRKNDIPILSLGDITTAVGPIGLFLGRIANFINSELWGRPADPSLPWAMIFPNGGPLPRHPSQLYEAGMEGILLFTLLAVMIRMGALKRPGLILGSFITFYGFARIIGEHFREPDPQLGFLWGGLTMGMLLSVPMIIAGAIIIVTAWRRKAERRKHISRQLQLRHAVTEISPLQSELKRLIKSSGPMPVWRYMEMCLTHPQYGYYVSRDPLGREGDFTTAPEVSQMFGELLGLWAASVWKAIGSPPILRLIELGPGRGTMMADALRALRVLPPLYQALSIHLVEINPVLREKQKATLSGVRNIAWHDGIDDVPDGPGGDPRQRIFRRAADPPGGAARERLARAHRRTRRQRQTGVRRRGRADPALRGAAAASGARGAGRRGVRMAARYRDHEDSPAGCATRTAPR